MTGLQRTWHAARATLCTLAASALALGPASAQAPAEAPLKLRIVGSLANLNPYVRHEQPFWSRELPRLSAGRIVAEIVPFDQAGIRGQEMLRLMQLGTVPFGTALLPLIQAVDPEVGAADLSGLNPDMKSLQRHFAAFRPRLEQLMRERHGIEVLAVYVYPAQVTFCSKPFSGLADLTGRRVRVSNVSQADLVRALGAVPVQTEFAEVAAMLKAGNVECAITGAMSGNLVGLHQITSHIDATALNWGLSIFGANLAVWNALPAHARALLKDELPKLERAIWAEAERETVEGLACNTGAAGCVAGRKGQMVATRPGAAEDQRIREIFVSTVMPLWLQRCGPGCAATWARYLAPVTGIEARPK